jgi:hypothetical protein
MSKLPLEPYCLIHCDNKYSYLNLGQYNPDDQQKLKEEKVKDPALSDVGALTIGVCLERSHVRELKK